MWVFPNKRNWSNFLKWYRTASKDKAFIPLVSGIQSTWQLERHNRCWKCDISIMHGVTMNERSTLASLNVMV